MSALTLILTIIPVLPTVLAAQVRDGEPIRYVLPRDAIAAILKPRFIDAADAGRMMADKEQVIGVVGPGGTAVAYSTWHLDRHEIVNDVVDGLPLAATW